MVPDFTTVIVEFQFLPGIRSSSPRWAPQQGLMDTYGFQFLPGIRSSSRWNATGVYLRSECGLNSFQELEVLPPKNAEVVNVKYRDYWFQLLPGIRSSSPHGWMENYQRVYAFQFLPGIRSSSP